MEAVKRLPSEVIVQILSYLALRDRKNVALVNKEWYYATLHPMFIKNEVFVFHFSHLANPFISEQGWSFSCYNRFGADSNRIRSIKVNEFKDFINSIINSKRTLLNLKFMHAPCLQSITLPLFSNRGLDIRSLYFDCRNHEYKNINDNCLSDSFLTQLMSQCRNLETLSICNFKIIMETYVPQNTLSKLTFFNLYGSDISGNTFNVLIKHFPKLETLCLESVIDEDLNGMYYSNTDNKLASVSNVINYLKPTKNLVTLKIDVLEIFYQISAHVKLNTLKIDCHVLSNCHETLVHYFQNQLYNQESTLKELEVDRLPPCFLSTILVLENLEQLQINSIFIKFHRDKSYLQSFLCSLTKMKHLKKLSIWPIYECNHYKSLFVFSQVTIRQLTSLDCYVYNATDVLNYGKNLVRLTIYNGEILTTNDIHLLFNNLTNLKFLRIDNCFNLNNDILSKLPISNLRDLITLSINGVKINHQYLRGIYHPNLKFLYFDKISFPDIKLLQYPSFCESFEESIKILSFSVPNLTVLNLKFTNTGYNVYDNIIKKSYCKLLKQLGIQKTHFKMY